MWKFKVKGGEGEKKKFEGWMGGWMGGGLRSVS